MNEIGPALSKMFGPHCLAVKDGGPFHSKNCRKLLLGAILAAYRLELFCRVCVFEQRIVFPKLATAVATSSTQGLWRSEG